MGKLGYFKWGRHRGRVRQGERERQRERKRERRDKYCLVSVKNTRKSY